MLTRMGPEGGKSTNKIWAQPLSGAGSVQPQNLGDMQIFLNGISVSCIFRRRPLRQWNPILFLLVPKRLKITF